MSKQAQRQRRKRQPIGERIIKALGGATAADVSRRVHEAYADGYNDAGEDEPISGTTKRYGYRKLGGGMRDTEIPRDQLLATAWSQWQSNPVAKRTMAIKRDYILGRGVTPSTKNVELQVIIDRFWRDNAMDRRAREFTHQLFLFGYQCLPVFVRKSDGRVQIGYIDPDYIKDVIHKPGNALDLWAVVCDGEPGFDTPWRSEIVTASANETAGESRTGKRVYRIIRREDDQAATDADVTDLGNGVGEVAGKPTTGLLVTHEQARLQDWETQMLAYYGLAEYTGSCFYEKVNSVSNQPLGMPDLMQAADWLDQHDETLFALAEREQTAGYFVWDVTLEGADEDAVQQKAEKVLLNPPRKGSANIHNNKEIWKLDAPDLKQQGSIETARAILTHILGGVGIPNHWYGYGDETNRATAQAQGDPTWRSLEHDQDIVGNLLTLMVEFARDQAYIAGLWGRGLSAEAVAETAITIIMPEMTTKDLTGIAGAASSLAMALQIAQDAAWIAPDDAAAAWARIMLELGVEVTPADVDTDSDETDNAQRDMTAADWLAAHGVQVDAGGNGVGAVPAPGLEPIAAA